MAGFISVHIDDFIPCLKDNSTGELVDTEVVRIRRSSFLSRERFQFACCTNSILGFSVNR